MGTRGESGQRGPDGDAAVGDPRAVPAGPVVSVHAAVLKPDVADAGWVVGKRVRDLKSRQIGERSRCWPQGWHSIGGQDCREGAAPGASRMQ